MPRICGEDYAAKGVSCTMVYSDLRLDAAAIRNHHSDYGYPERIPGVKDNGHKIADATGATITPQAVIVGKNGKVLYRGRIDNFYAALGKPRRMATEHDLRDALDEVREAGKAVTPSPNTSPGMPHPALKNRTTTP